jgi:hypothetical protein
VKEIVLNNSKIAIVSDHRFSELNQWHWHAYKDHNVWYAVRHTYLPNGKRTTIRMHQQIMGSLPDGELIDHRDSNGLNNQDDNLRICSSRQNSQNKRKSRTSRSKYKGIYFDKEMQKWRARISYEGKRINLGYFFSEKEAAQAYNEAAIKFYGDFANNKTISHE